mmetsp:Transcript_39486/g.72850  ORF Transcript_39486/g.72850 Transcript_39486/m.72850 type:complete len:576 (-) Transcript_39486:219-1946(-)
MSHRSHVLAASIVAASTVRSTFSAHAAASAPHPPIAAFNRAQSSAFASPFALGSSWSQRSLFRCELTANVRVDLSQKEAHGTRPNFRRTAAAMLLSTKADPTGSVSDVLRTAYREGDTDAVLAAAPDLLRQHSARELIVAAIDAADGRTGPSASIANALLGGCVRISSETEGGGEFGAGMARDLLDEWDDLGDEGDFEVAAPDLVTFCLAYAALDAGGEPAWTAVANNVLDRARRLAKKRGGSKIRKAANRAARRRGRPDDGDTVGGEMIATDAADELAARYGTDFRILHEDADLVVVSKPSGMVCFHKHKTTAGKVGKKKRKKKRGNSGGDSDSEDGENGNIPDVSLEDSLASLDVPLSNLNPDGRGIVHRIDRGTSGCVVLAKTDEAHARLVAEFFTRGAFKRYDALVPARPSSASGVATAVVGSGELEESGEIDLPVDGKASRSIYEVKRRIGDVCLLLGLETKTGRKHQVRVHCSEGLGRPLYLDPVYGAPRVTKAAGSRSKKGRGSRVLDEEVPGDLPDPIARIAKGSEGRQRFFLHASALRIPKLGVDVTAPLPLWWQEALTELEGSGC